MSARRAHTDRAQRRPSVGTRLVLCAMFAGMAAAQEQTTLHAQTPADVAATSFSRLFPAPCAGPIGRFARIQEGWMTGVDTTAYRPSKDTMYTRSRDATRRCLESFGGTSSRAGDQLDLARSHLALSEEAIATTLADTYVRTLPSTPGTQRAWALLLTVRDYLNAHPARIAEARTVIAQLEGLGSAAIGYRFRAYVELSTAAQRTWDDTLTEQVYDTILAQWKRLPPGDADRWHSIAGIAYIGKAEIAQRRRTMQEAVRLMDTAKAVIPQGGFWLKQIEPRWSTYTEILGKPAPSLDAIWWFGATGKRSESRPRKGVVTAVIYGGGPGIIRAMNRWEERFRDQFESIILANTQGWIRDTAPILPRDEAEYQYRELQRMYQSRSLFAVFETEYDWLKDGRRQNRPLSANVPPYYNLVIIDRNGIVRYVHVPPFPQLTELYWEWEELIGRKIAQLIEEENGT